MGIRKERSPTYGPSCLFGWKKSYRDVFSINEYRCLVGRHRNRSTPVDFNFFPEKALDREGIHAAFPFLARSIVLQDQSNILTVNVPSQDAERECFKVSFFGVIDFGRVGEPEITEDGVLQVASLDDLMATKLKVILQRAEAKDYRDIAAMVKAGVDLSKGLFAARELFGMNFQPSESLKAMVYFQHGDRGTLTRDEKSCLIHAASAVRDPPRVEVSARRLTAAP